MQRVCSAALLLFVLLGASARPAFAHHSVLPFDGARGVTVTGTVATVLWQNPHTLIALDVQQDDGTIRRWAVESEAPRLLTRLGWAPDTIKGGDRITVLGAAARDGSSALRCKSVELADGREFACFPATAPAGDGRLR
jgi:uncharacterized protein DUF6152